MGCWAHPALRGGSPTGPHPTCYHTGLPALIAHVSFIVCQLTVNRPDPPGLHPSPITLSFPLKWKN